MKVFFLNLLLILFSYVGIAQDWGPWISIEDGAYNRIQISYKILPNSFLHEMVYRFKNGYSGNVCGEIYINYTTISGESIKSWCHVELRANELKENFGWNRISVASVQSVTSAKIKYCNGRSLTGSSTKPTSYHYAVCDDKLPLSSHGSLGWCGNKRDSFKEADSDAKAHNDKFKHQASVCSGTCPTCN